MTNRPYFVGIMGGTGSGKTTLAANLAEGLPNGAIATLCQDSYYTPHPELSPNSRDALNFDHPRAVDFDLLVDHLDALAQQQPVEVPIYDFVSHLRHPHTRTVQPASIFLVEGILLFVEEGIRERLDLKLFVDTDADVRSFRRIKRDMAERGRSFAQVESQYFTTVRPMHLQYVEPAKRWADITVPGGGNNEVAVDLVLSKLRPLCK